MGYIPYSYQKNFTYDKGWDAYAEDYIKLLKPGTIYYLTKEIAHLIISRYIGREKDLSILDLNCGTGNDFPFFLQNGWNIYGCDGSAGMLNKAWEQYKEQIKTGRIKLYLGFMEDLEIDSFDGQKFDLIYSITGGYSFIDDTQFVGVNEKLGYHLKDGGFIITAHLTKFSLSEFLYKIVSLKWKSLLVRLKKELTVNIRNEKYKMSLRGYHRLKRLTPAGLELVEMHPLLALTPPYQSGYTPPKLFLNLHKWVECRVIDINIFNYIADQIVTVYRKAGAST